MIRLVNIDKKFYTQSGNRFRYILKKVNFTLPDHGLVAILGPSGCGKTTLLNVISTLETPDGGELYFDDVESTRLTNAQKDELRHLHIGYIYQEHNLIDHLTVHDNIKLSFDLGSTLNKKEEKERIKELIEQFHLEEIEYSYPTSLSGGEKERVAIARALANDPNIILADEPTGSLDDDNAIEIMKLLKKLSQNKLVVLVSHNQELVNEYADDILRIKNGKIISNSLQNKNIINEKQTSDFAERKINSRPESIFKLATRRIFKKRGRYSFIVLINALGVTGIALTLAAFRGADQFAKSAEQDALTSYPLTVSSIYSGTDNSLLDDGSGPLFPNDNNVYRRDHDNSAIGVNAITQEYVDYLIENLPNDDIVIRGGLAPQIIVENSQKDGINNFQAKDIDDFLGFESIFEGTNNYFRPLNVRKETILQSYDLIYGNYPEKDDESLFVLDNRNNFPAYALDLFGISGSTISFDDVLKKTFKFINNDDYYIERTDGALTVTGNFLKTNDVLKAENKQADQVEKHLLKALEAYNNDEGGEDSQSKKIIEEEMNIVESYFEEEESTRDLKWYSPKSTSALKKMFYDENIGETMKISGILRPKKMQTFPFLKPGVYYSMAYAEKFRQQNEASAFCQELPNHCTFKKKTFYGGLSIPSIYGYSKDTDLVEGSNEQLISAIYSYFLNRKIYGCDESLYEVRILCQSYEAKDNAKKVMDAWNDNHSGDQIMEYMDIGTMIIKTIRRYTSILMAVIYAVITIVILSNTLVTSLTAILEINSRKREIGIYRSLGGKKSYVRTLFMSEQGIAGLAAGIVGLILTYAIIPILNIFIKASVKGALIDNFANLPIYFAFIIIAGSIIIGLISTLVPAILATKAKPSKALRNI